MHTLNGHILCQQLFFKVCVVRSCNPSDVCLSFHNVNFLSSQVGNCASSFFHSKQEPKHQIPQHTRAQIRPPELYFEDLVSSWIGGYTQITYHKLLWL